MKHKKISAADLTLAALFAALTAVFSQISFPLPFTPVPINLATLAFMLAGSLLGPSAGLLSQLVFLCLGLCGLPVFAEFTGGPGILFGPTGGYIPGYAAGACVIGLLFEHLPASTCRAATSTDASTCRAAAGADASASSPAARPQPQRLPQFLTVCIFLLGLCLCYLLGTLWFMFQTGNSLAASLLMCVWPFLPGEILKVIAAVLLTRRLRPHILNLEGRE